MLEGYLDFQKYNTRYSFDIFFFIFATYVSNES